MDYSKGAIIKSNIIPIGGIPDLSNNKEFQFRFNSVTRNIFEKDFDWNNVAFVGGSIVDILIGHTINRKYMISSIYETQNKINDFDIYVYGLNQEETINKIEYIVKYIKYMGETKRLCSYQIDDDDEEAINIDLMVTVNSINIKIGYNPKNGCHTFYNFQVITRSYKDISSIVSKFDFGACKVAYDGNKLHYTPDALEQFNTMMIDLDNVKFHNKLIFRLTKYIFKGFDIFVKNYNFNKITSYIDYFGLFQKKYREYKPTLSPEDHKELYEDIKMYQSFKDIIKQDEYLETKSYRLRQYINFMNNSLTFKSLLCNFVYDENVKYPYKTVQIVEPNYEFRKLTKNNYRLNKVNNIENNEVDDHNRYGVSFNEKHIIKNFRKYGILIKKVKDIDSIFRTQNSYNFDEFADRTHKRLVLEKIDYNLEDYIRLAVKSFNHSTQFGGMVDYIRNLPPDIQQPIINKMSEEVVKDRYQKYDIINQNYSYSQQYKDEEKGIYKVSKSEYNQVIDRTKKGFINDKIYLNGIVESLFHSCDEFKEEFDQTIGKIFDNFYDKYLVKYNKIIDEFDPNYKESIKELKEFWMTPMTTVLSEENLKDKPLFDMPYTTKEKFFESSARPVDAK
jgi:hypothetical protein